MQVDRSLSDDLDVPQRKGCGVVERELLLWLRIIDALVRKRKGVKYIDTGKNVRLIIKNNWPTAFTYK